MISNMNYPRNSDTVAHDLLSFTALCALLHFDALQVLTECSLPERSLLTHSSHFHDDPISFTTFNLKSNVTEHLKLD